MNSTESFIADLDNLAQSNLPESLLDAARLRLLDYVGVTLAGAAMLGEKGTRLLDRLAADAGGATVIGMSRKANPQAAALLNGTSAHVAELDDGERFGMIHPGAPVISAVLAVSEAQDLPMPDLLRGIVIGYEAAIRFARAVQPGLKDRGHHATGVCGTIGAALGVAATLRFSRTQMSDAFAAAATSASGLLSVIRGVSELKPYNAGQAALAGLTAAMVAQAGFAGPVDVLDGDQGLLRILTGKQDAHIRERSDQEPLAIQRVYVKPYAACRHCHAPIEAALKIRAEHGIIPRDVSQIRVTTHRWAVHLHDHVEIEGVTSAKMSVPYSVAVALQTGRAGLAEFTPERVRDAQILELTRRVEVHSDAGLTALVPAVRAAIVEISTHEGRSYRHRIDLPKGEPEVPLSQDELNEKFDSLAIFAGKTQEQAIRIRQAILESTDTIRHLLALI